ncbi:hypothetical protein FD33_GL002446 [Companilactobacillus paralimentarius DSM 13238 = JCM 10415]|uniref:Schlafen group 3-like DNA/RNA helicase domain-containing protein n=1 Tax=Companilactobacillus paralimentarius DSM 13238 = JCM 10415 TaxID=1122151 RepID=A0A0R1PPR4_9LACO|nr:DUF2075 domain-containing protein [Companilactobacillus paralimentarius]KAE9564672.1 DNA replication initiation protein [Companilactobacillus paralimentarius]KRL30923.1 hypothetical protein FD33_GL002446 [Companilactobacillus paralimentarius DSM 13238 = JCM 10415]QFR70418.1 DUF2075 domain-containing protein [Companilactobacillus paralimentarius]
MLESVFPNKDLTKQQQAIFDQILSFTNQGLKSPQKSIFQLNGDAGTGKSVILTQLFLNIETLAKQNKTDNYFLVNHPELLKVYQENAGEFGQLRKNRFLRPTTFINRMHKNQQQADVVVIDEAHLLLSESDNYNNFTQKNQLSEIIKLSKVVILVFDAHQVLKLKSYWSDNFLKQIIPNQVNFESATLTTQMRMQAPQKVLQWINDLTDNLQITPLEQENTNYLSMNSTYDFRVYHDAEKMYQALKTKNKEVGESRIVATADYPSTLDGKKHYVNEGEFHLPWDQYNYSNTTWAQKPETINEIGSIYTVQGFDLNYVAVIIGPSIAYDKNNRIKIDIDKYEDQEAFKKRHDNDIVNLNDVKKRIILNSMNVLLKRGVKGCFVYFHDSRIFDQLKK